jgi:2,4-dienoyl-CoA reductase-like NADH-dependent reductase (Old Yellow Enzyme family)
MTVAPDPPAPGAGHGPGLPTAPDPLTTARSRVFSPATLGPLTLRNRIVKAATFEGACPRGEVTGELVDFHARVAAGGSAMSTVAYLAVSPEGRTDRGCLVLAPGTVAGLRRVTDAIHAEGAAAAAQVGHAGPVANARSNRSPALAPSRRLTMAGTVAREATGEDIRRITGAYRTAAALAVEAGFDAVEVHLGHDYLLSAFLNPRLNRRSDRWGGSVEGRARFPRQVLEAVRSAVGDGVAVTAKLNMADGVPGGLWLDESLATARLLEADGHLHALELTGGSSLANPMYLFRGEAPLADFAATLPAPLRAGFKVVGRRFMPSYPFEEAYFLPYARQFRAALRLPLILLGGINRLDTAARAVDEGFELVAMARALLRQPGLVNAMRAGAAEEGLCVHCNRCMPTIYSGTRCVLV